MQHRLDVLGFSQDEIAVRMAMASDADLHQLATQSEDVLAGGDALEKAGDAVERAGASMREPPEPITAED